VSITFTVMNCGRLACPDGGLEDSIT